MRFALHCRPLGQRQLVTRLVVTRRLSHPRERIIEIKVSRDADIDQLQSCRHHRSTPPDAAFDDGAGDWLACDVRNGVHQCPDAINRRHRVRLNALDYRHLAIRRLHRKTGRIDDLVTALVEKAEQRIAQKWFQHPVLHSMLSYIATLALPPYRDSMRLWTSVPIARVSATI